MNLGVSPGELWVYDLARSSISRVATDTFPCPPSGPRAVSVDLRVGAGRASLEPVVSTSGWRGRRERLSTSDEVQTHWLCRPMARTWFFGRVGARRGTFS